LVTSRILFTSADVYVPAVLVESDSTVIVPVIYKGYQLVKFGVRKALVALDKAQDVRLR
jgi:hypothetical protein